MQTLAEQSGTASTGRMRKKRARCAEPNAITHAQSKGHYDARDERDRDILTELGKPHSVGSDGALPLSVGEPGDLADGGFSGSNTPADRRWFTEARTDRRVGVGISGSIGSTGQVGYAEELLRLTVRVFQWRELVLLP